MEDVNTSFSVNQSDHNNEVIDENIEGIVTFLCDEDIQELQTRKLTVLTTISVLTLLSNMAILLAILSRQGKVTIQRNYIKKSVNMQFVIHTEYQYSYLLCSK